MGASGDLAPLAHLALALLGEGQMWSPKSGWADASLVSTYFCLPLNQINVNFCDILGLGILSIKSYGGKFYCFQMRSNRSIKSKLYIVTESNSLRSALP